MMSLWARARPISGILAAGALLTGILITLVADRVRLLAGGREIELAIRPVDPRDLFKGDYVQLAFDISELDRAIAPADAAPPKGAADWRSAVRTVYVTLQRAADGSWKPVAVADALPTGLGAERIAIKGQSLTWDRRRVAYGIERYFVPEGAGRRLEDLARQAKLGAIVAVDRRGNAAIKGLVIDGKRVYEEPLL